MVATVIVNSYHGAAGATVTDVTGSTVRFKKADNDTQDYANRIPIPPSGTEYSFVKHFALFASSSPAALIDTCKMYGDGALPTGVQMFARDNGYINPLTQLDTPLTGWANDYASRTSLAKLDIAGSKANPATGKIYTNYLQMQMGVVSAAASGVMAAETTTLEYLEA